MEPYGRWSIRSTTCTLIRVGSTKSPAMNEYSTCTVGIDIGDCKSVACIYSSDAVVDWFEFVMTLDGVRAAVAGKGYRTVAMEAGQGAIAHATSLEKLLLWFYAEQ